jgi:lysozyme
MIRYLSVCIAFILALGICDYYGLIWHNSIFTAGYEVKGLDVSHHQGKINWQRVKEESKYEFVYIKATEGKDFLDDRFLYNWTEANNKGFLTGAYHFFSMQSSGREQAEHFSKVVPVLSSSMPPVIDVEISLSHDKKKVSDNLQTMINVLEQKYNKKPILYVTYSTYHTYIEQDFPGYPIWIRDVFKYPSIDKAKWMIWQYHNRGHVDGIGTYVDINVFKGEKSELEQLK